MFPLGTALKVQKKMDYSGVKYEGPQSLNTDSYPPKFFPI